MYNTICALWPLSFLSKSLSCDERTHTHSCLPSVFWDSEISQNAGRMRNLKLRKWKNWRLDFVWFFESTTYCRGIFDRKHLVNRVAGRILLLSSSKTSTTFYIVRFMNTHTHNYFYVRFLRHIIIPHANNNNHRLMYDTARNLVEGLHAFVHTVLWGSDGNAVLKDNVIQYRIWMCTHKCRHICTGGGGDNVAFCGCTFLAYRKQCTQFSIKWNEMKWNACSGYSTYVLMHMHTMYSSNNRILCHFMHVHLCAHFTCGYHTQISLHSYLR